MTIQPSLFDVPPRRPTAPYQKSSATSKAAADRIAPRAHIQREAVFQYIASRPTATMKEIERDTGILRSSICARINELQRAGRIRKAYGLEREGVQMVRREGCAAYESISGRVAVRGAA